MTHNQTNHEAGADVLASSMTGGSVNITNEAIEAVAEIYAESEDTGSLATARAALEAAMPHLTNQVLS